MRLYVDVLPWIVGESVALLVVINGIVLMRILDVPKVVAIILVVPFGFITFLFVRRFYRSWGLKLGD